MKKLILLWSGLLCLQNYNHRVDISSKLVTRITRLPYLTDPSNAEIQMIDVTTQVYPSNMGEAPVPWWVLLLAVLGGLLLLGVFVYGLYKVVGTYLV